MVHRLHRLCIATGLSLLLTWPALASPPASPQINACMHSRILHLAGRQRVLTQKMAKEVLLIGLEVDVRYNLGNLAHSALTFDQTLKGLRDGNSEMELPRLRDKALLQQLTRTDRVWEHFFTLVVGPVLEEEKATARTIKRMERLNLALLKETNRYVDLYTQKAKGAGIKTLPEHERAVTQSAAELVLVQKLAKEFLYVAYRHDIAVYRQQLKKTCSQFDRILKNLKNDKGRGSSPEVTGGAITIQLATISREWKKLRPLVLAACSGREIAPEYIQVLSESEMPLLIEVDRIAALYKSNATLALAQAMGKAKEDSFTILSSPAPIQ